MPRFLRELPIQWTLLVSAIGSTALAQSPSIFLVPNPIDAGGPAITATVAGRGLIRGAVAYWGTTPLPTEFVDAQTLRVTIASKLTALSGEAFVTVKNPDGAVSNSDKVLLQPVLLTIGPPVPKGSTSAMVTATGLGFVPSDVVRLMGEPPRGLLTTYVSSTTLTALVPADIAATSAVRPAWIGDVLTGSFSRNVVLLIGNPPILNSLAPSQAVVDGPGVTLTLTGSGFAPGAAARWSESRLPTVFVSSTELRATVDAVLLRRSVVQINSGISVSVINPDGGLSSYQYFWVTNAVPTISRLDPSWVAAGGPEFAMDVGGTNYYTGSQVTFDGTPLTTQFINSTLLKATVPASLIARAAEAAVTVVNGARLMDAGVSSTSFGFSIRPPTLERVTPASVKAGAPEFTLTVNGTGFFSGHSIFWNGSALPTQYIGPTELTAVVTADRVAAPGSVDISVRGASGAMTNVTGFRIDPLPPAIASLRPGSVAVGAPVFTLTVAGSNFIPGAVIHWNDRALETSFVGPGELTAIIASELVAHPGDAAITVVTPSGATNSAPFLVTGGLPAVKSGGVSNSFSGEPVLAPGGLMTIDGENLAEQFAAAEGYPLPLALGGTSVTINGKPAPVLNASPAELKVQVPFDVAIGAGALVVAVNGVQSFATGITIAETAPGTSKTSESKSNHALALNEASGTPNSAETPASPGEYIIVSMTGQGRVDNPIGAGEAVPDTPSFVPVAQLEAKIGGQPAEVAFARLAPGCAGILQVKLKIPDVGPGQQILEVLIGGVRSNTTVVSVGTSRPGSVSPIRGQPYGRHDRTRLR